MSSIESPGEEFERAARMRVDSNPLVGIFAASLAAGPLVLVIVTIGMIVTNAWHGDHTLHGILADVNYPLQAGFLSVIVGLVLSLIPNALGCMAPGLRGTILPPVRLWSAWILSGGAAGAALGLMVTGFSGIEVLILGALVGAGCAAMCRAFTRSLPL